MDSEYGSDFISIEDEDGHQYELEVLDTLEFDDTTYLACISASDENENADDGLIILKSVTENGEEFLSTLDSDDELNKIYDLFMDRLFDEDEEESEDEE